MRCPQCGHENLGEARFCGECSAPLYGCPSCGRANRPAAKFCDECGAALAGGSTAGEREAPVPFGHDPRFVNERILSRRSAREGERKLVTVLFADIADSSRLAQQLDAEVLHDVLDRVLRLVAEIVHRHDGTVSHYLGDGLMALFGAPVALEDHALRAVHAALQMQDQIAIRCEEFRREHGAETRLRVGLDTGRVVVGLIGDRVRMDYTAMGNTAHVAARMEALAEPGSILVTEATWHAVAGDIDGERIGPVAVRGQRRPITVYRVIGRKRARNRLGRGRGTRLTKFIGRYRELEMLQQRLADAAAGRGQAVAIAGEAGLGKSRLLHEFRDAIDARGADWVEGGCDANAQGVPYAPILELLRDLFQIDEGDALPEIRTKLTERAKALCLGGGKLPLVEFLFGIPGAEDALRGLDPRVRRERTWEAIIEVCAAASRQRPLVLAVENLHWSDQS
jgi:class 3 adenylate cyclase